MIRIPLACVLTGLAALLCIWALLPPNTAEYASESALHEGQSREAVLGADLNLADRQREDHLASVPPRFVVYHTGGLDRESSLTLTRALAGGSATVSMLPASHAIDAIHGYPHAVHIFLPEATELVEDLAFLAVALESARVIAMGRAGIELLARRGGWAYGYASIHRQQILVREAAGNRAWILHNREVPGGSVATLLLSPYERRLYPQHETIARWEEQRAYVLAAGGGFAVYFGVESPPSMWSDSCLQAIVSSATRLAASEFGDEFVDRNAFLHPAGTWAFELGGFGEDEGECRRTFPFELDTPATVTAAVTSSSHEARLSLRLVPVSGPYDRGRDMCHAIEFGSTTLTCTLTKQRLSRSRRWLLEVTQNAGHSTRCELTVRAEPVPSGD